MRKEVNTNPARTPSSQAILKILSKKNRVDPVNLVFA